MDPLPVIQTPPPLHGYRGEPSPSPPIQRPQGLTVVISREAGARGGGIARRLGRQLGWQVFDQETLGYLTQDVNAKEELLADIPAPALVWANHQVGKLIQTRSLPSDGGQTELIRLLFILAARGDVVLVDRGSGVLLPVKSTLNVRIVAPLNERVAYMGQWLRMPVEEAAAEVANRDRVRAELHRVFTEREPNDPTQYDLILNSSRLGEAACTALIVHALKEKQLPQERPEENAVDPV